MKVLEKNITKAIIAYIRGLPNSWAVKTHGGPFTAGEPDVTACIGGLSVHLEVKVPGKVATPLQEANLAKWAKSGALTGVVCSVHDVVKLLENHGIPTRGN